MENRNIFLKLIIVFMAGVACFQNHEGVKLKYGKNYKINMVN